MTYLNSVNENGIVTTPFTVYKSAQDCIVELSLPVGTKTNLRREDVVCADHAKFRCNQGVVVSITRKTSDEHLNQVSSDHRSSFKYIIGEKVVENEFDDDLNKVCTSGIHFYLTQKTAFFHYLDVTNYTGEYLQYHDNGNLWEKCYYIKDGKLEGEYLMYYNNGTLYEKSYYVNDELEGEYLMYYDNGELCVKCFYVNGEREGEYLEYRNNGKLLIKSFYTNGKLEGEYLEYYSNVKLFKKYFYVNGKREG